MIEFLVEEDNYGRTYWHQEDDPRMLRPQLCGEVNAQREDTGNRTDDRAAQKTVAQESDYLHEACFDLEENCFHLVSEVIAVKIHILPPQ